MENIPVAGDPAGAGAGRGANPPLGFSELYTQVFWTCQRSICHGGAVAGLDMSTPAAAHAGLVDQPAQPDGKCAFTGMTRVVPFQPDQSLLMAKLQSSVPCGQQMPIGGLLSEENRAAVRAWIVAGAPFD
jgi:hypothetical protein